jgi:hypothetical protein
VTAFDLIVWVGGAALAVSLVLLFFHGAGRLGEMEDQEEWDGYSIKPPNVESPPSREAPL